MARMRSNLLESFVFVWLVASGEAILTLPHGKESPSGRNNLADILSPKSELSAPVTASSSPYECLYVSPDLPVCDIERMEDSGEDITHSTADYYRETKASAENFGKGRRPRIRRNVVAGMKATPEDSPGRQIIVYTIEGCLPPRLPFEMPSCQQKSSRDKILGVRKLYPFTVKGLTRPPLIFPEFDVDRWTRMMKRLRSHVPTNAEKRRGVIAKSEALAAKKGAHSRANLLTDVATTKATTPNRTMASTEVLKSSFPGGSMLHKQGRSGKVAKAGQRQIKVEDAPASIKAERPGTKRKTYREESFASLEVEKTNGDAPRSNVRSPKSETLGRKAKSDSDVRRKKTELPRSRKSCHGQQKSGNSAGYQERSPNEQRSITANQRNQDPTWDAVPEIPTFKSRVRKPKGHIYGNPNPFDDLLDKLEIGANFIEVPNLLRSVSSDEVNGFPSRRRTVADANNEVVTGLNELPSLLTENSRARREIRVSGGTSRQMLPSNVKAHEVVEKSTSQRHRIPREVRDSRGNSLGTLDKTDKISHFKGNRFVSDDRGTASKNRGTCAHKLSKPKMKDTADDSTFKSKSDFSNMVKGVRDKGALLDKSKVTSQKELDEKVSMRKKYWNHKKSISKYDERLHRQ